VLQLLPNEKVGYDSTLRIIISHHQSTSTCPSSEPPHLNLKPSTLPTQCGRRDGASWRVRATRLAVALRRRLLLLATPM